MIKRKTTRQLSWTWVLGAIVLAPLAQAQVLAQRYPVSPQQNATAQQVARTGVPLSELAPNAPDNYTVKSGDTLWAIAGLYLKSPWRWPELWGMNLQEIRNPNLIYPGQQLFLEKTDGRATLSLRARGPNDGPPTDTIRISPRTRYEPLRDNAIPTLSPSAIEPFLAEPVVVEEGTLLSAPRIVGTQEGRVLLTRGDRAYARGELRLGEGSPASFRVFRNVTPLKDPGTGLILGYEAQYVGKADLIRGESLQESEGKGGSVQTDIIPATIDIVAAKEEMRVGDRLLPEPPREMSTYIPRAPDSKVEARVVSVYGSAVNMAAENQVIAINRGERDGMARGYVLAIIKDGERLVDRTDSSKTSIKLPDERTGLAMVFRVFDRVSYALVLQVNDGVKIGDRLINPR